ncbi:MAG: hypothetical protein ABF608_11350 [Sporolactobacillus sp.]
MDDKVNRPFTHGDRVKQVMKGLGFYVVICLGISLFVGLVVFGYGEAFVHCASIKNNLLKNAVFSTLMVSIVAFGLGLVVIVVVKLNKWFLDDLLRGN